MAFLGPNNALAWSHFRLRGGWKRSLAFTIGAVVVIAMLIGGAIYSDPVRSTRNLYSWTTGLLGLQTATLVLYTAGRVGAAIRGDVQSKIIESHRLMPTPPAEAIAGYISGAAMQPLIFVVAVFFIGVYTSNGAGIELQRWLFAHAILVAFALFIWTASAYATFAARLGPAMVFIPMFIAPYATQGGGLAAVPGLMVLLSPIVGASIFDLRSTGITLPANYAMALAGQFYFGTIFFLAAARRYRAADGVGIDTTLGLLLVAGWAAITCVGLHDWEAYRPRGWGVFEVEHSTRIIASLLVGTVIAFAPVAAAAWTHMRWRRH